MSREQDSSPFALSADLQHESDKVSPKPLYSAVTSFVITFGLSFGTLVGVFVFLETLVPQTSRWDSYSIVSHLSYGSMIGFVPAAFCSTLAAQLSAGRSTMREICLAFAVIGLPLFLVFLFSGWVAELRAWMFFASAGSLFALHLLATLFFGWLFAGFESYSLQDR